MIFNQQLRRLDACSEAIEWLGDRSLEEGWRECPSGTWMLWLLGKAYVEFTPQMRLCVCTAIRRGAVWGLLTDPRSREAVEVAERFARGQATVGKLKAAEAAAWATEAAVGTAELAAERAAWAATEAAVWAAAWAAELAAWAAELAAWAADRAAESKLWADVVREFFPDPPTLEPVTQNPTRREG